MSLETERNTLLRLAAEFQQGDFTNTDKVRDLCKAAQAYTLALDRARAAATPKAQNQEGATVTIPFGRSKGKTLTEAAQTDLEWVLGCVRTSVDDPTKAQYRAKNIELAEAIERELSRR